MAVSGGGAGRRQRAVRAFGLLCLDMPSGSYDLCAAVWLERAAEQHHAAAECQLGLLYREGRGVGRSGSRAAQWLGWAAEGGCLLNEATPCEMVRRES